ncbi:MAG TPA: DUF488 domain-containing protein [Alphaproteobacteria bacterium]|nr:DUF488 domain-containing protein [Alphaproteobacteria bacterium]
MTGVQLKRAYDPPSPEDGRRVLVDRLWPRGLARADAKIDLWLKDAAPSAELRRWYGHDPARWPEFRERYLAELAANPEPLKTLRDLLRQGPVTLLFAKRDVEHNNAMVLKEAVERGT